MSRKPQGQRPTQPATASAEADAPNTVEATSEGREATDSTDTAPASMRDAMRAALDAKASRQGHAPGNGPRGGSDGPAGRGGGAKGFRALPRRSAG